MAQAVDERLTLLIQGTLALDEAHRTESESLLQQVQRLTVLPDAWNDRFAS